MHEACLTAPTPPRRRRTDGNGEDFASTAAFEAGYAQAVKSCIAIVLRHFANDYSGVACLEELRRLGEP